MISRRRFFRTGALGAASLAVGSKLFGKSTKLSAKANLLGFLPDQLSMNPTSYYARLFQRGPASTCAIEKGLEELGRAMVDGDEQGDDNEEVAAGYTYLGQFIDHDLTLDVTPLERAIPEMDRTPNFRTPFLDLDHLYGGGPNVSPFLYDQSSERGKEKFLIGQTTLKTVDGRTLDGGTSLDDLPRNLQGIALVGDPRQDENLILAQLHVAFLKLHNRVIACPTTYLNESPYYRHDERGTTLTDFEAARRLVTWHYQWIVRHDYLRQILDPKVFAYVTPDKYKPILPASPEDFRIPVEFSVAAFRFGHSMVRDSYRYNDRHDQIDLLCLLALTGTGSQIPCKDFPRCKGFPFSLPADLVIKFDRFFYIPPFTKLVFSRKIDTQIAKALHGLPVQTANLFSAPMPNEPPKELPLPVKTLLRGARVGLPSGQDVVKELSGKLGEKLCEKLKLKRLEPAEIANNPRDAAILQQHGFDTKTPLWYYILKESEARNSGKKLGPVGSLIVADVITGALRADPNSYLTVAGENSSITAQCKWWQPTLPGVQGSICDGSVSYGMPDLLKFLLVDLKPCS